MIRLYFAAICRYPAMIANHAIFGAVCDAILAIAYRIIIAPYFPKPKPISIILGKLMQEDLSCKASFNRSSFL